MRERRRYPRVLQPFDAQYHPRGNFMGGWCSMRILNLGAGGMRFTTEELLEEGALLEIQVTLPIILEPLALVARVVWRQTLASGVVEHGVEFADLTPQQSEKLDELVRFLVKQPPKPSA